MRLAWIGVAAALPLLLVGCTEEVQCICDGYPTYDASGEGGSSGPSAQPVLVRVQPGKTLTAAPGKGVGVFVQYATGGHWTIWWTCDTNATGQSCNYDINATTKDGSITNVAGYDGTTLSPPDGGLEGGGAEAGPPSFPILASVTNQIQGVTFDTNPGASIEVTAALNGNYDGSLFFFVDDGKKNDGYKGPLTDPLEFQPAAP
jgi:hypothetical protein